jgi:hypothetical protein
MMKKIYNLLLALLVLLTVCALPVMAADGDSSGSDLSFTDMLKAKESYSEVQSSDLNTPIEKTNKYVVGAIIFLVFLALAIGLIKYLYGNPMSSSDGLMHMFKVVLGVAVFIFCGIMAFTIINWK